MGSTTSNNDKKSPTPFDFKKLNDSVAAAPEAPTPVFVKATDGIDMAVRIYRPATSIQPKGVLVFYHGGGANSAGGYQLLGQGLANEYGLVVYTPDLRGHGASQGPTGDAPTVEQVLVDANTVLDFVEQNEQDSKFPLFLGGHSSGGGFVLNYATWEGRSTYEKKIVAYLLVSPQLGYLAQVDRPDIDMPFAKVNILAFLANGLTGWWGHNPAVQFQYPPEILRDHDGMARYNTVNMANAITPNDPKGQFEAISKKTALWIGEDDELFVASKVAKYAIDQENMEGHVLSGESHLGILAKIHQQIGPWILQHIV